MRADALIANWVAQPWAMRRTNMMAGLQQLVNLDINAKDTARMSRLIGDTGPFDPKAGFKVEDGVGLITVDGVLMKEVPPCYGFFGEGNATGTDDLNLTIRAAINDSRVDSILLEIDSPGGQVAGTQELGDLIANSPKDIHASIRDMACSGALWIASQCKTVSANRTAVIGSIGVYLVVDDYFKMYEEAGVTVNVISTGPQKGAGVTGTHVTQEQLDADQIFVDAMGVLFQEALVAGRNLPADKVATMATGDVWLATEALSMGLIDFVENYDDAFERVAAA